MRQMLLVVDNVEQIRDVGVCINEIVQNTRHVTILATSRRSLHLRQEHEYRLSGLTLPSARDLGAVQQSGAVQLFMSEARRKRPGFNVTPENVNEVVGLCEALDGLPLAIELAASQWRLLSPRAILARLDKALDLSLIAADRHDYGSTSPRRSWSFSTAHSSGLPTTTVASRA